MYCTKHTVASSPILEECLKLRDATQKKNPKAKGTSKKELPGNFPNCFWSKVLQGTERMQVHATGTRHKVILCFGTHSWSPACTKATSNTLQEKWTYRKEKKRVIIYIPYLKGRSKHWDMLLTQTYMLAHIPLTKINILDSVLTFTSSFSSHWNHYNYCIYSSPPSLIPCHVHTLPSASTSFLFYLSAGWLLSSLYQW